MSSRLVGWLALLGTTVSAPLGALPSGAGSAQAFAFDPRHPDTVYVATVSYPHGTTRGHVYRSTDGGRHWSATATKGVGWTGDIASLAADPQHPGVLYAGTTVAVYKTVDGGRSWRPFNKGLFPRQRRVCYRGTGAGKLQCIKLPVGTPGTPNFNRGNGWVNDIVVDPADTNVVYATADGVRKSTDGGHIWHAVFLPYRGLGSVSGLAVAATRPESFYAIAHGPNGRGSIYRSTDAGKTWHPTGAGKTDYVSARRRSAATDDAVHRHRKHGPEEHRRRPELAAGDEWPLRRRLRARRRPTTVRKRLRGLVRRHVQDDERRAHLDAGRLESLDLDHRDRARPAVDDPCRRGPAACPRQRAPPEHGQGRHLDGDRVTALP
jgi:hypothetical protein